MVQTALKERLFAAVDAYREAELARLQRVKDESWPKSMAGNYRAGYAVVDGMEMRIRLLRLDQATMESNRCHVSARSTAPTGRGGPLGGSRTWPRGRSAVRARG
jgi:hypothetical protein